MREGLIKKQSMYSCRGQRGRQRGEERGGSDMIQGAEPRRRDGKKQSLWRGGAVGISVLEGRP